MIHTMTSSECRNVMVTFDNFNIAAEVSQLVNPHCNDEATISEPSEELELL